MDRFIALADPTRRKILSLVARRTQRASDIAAHFDMSPPAISQHLKALRETGLIRVERRGRERIYSLNPEGLGKMEEWIAQTRAIWNERLDKLEDVLRED